MIQYLEYLKAPATVVFAFVAIVAAMNFVGEIIEFKGKVAPEFLKMRKYFARKKKERETLVEVQKTLAEVQRTQAEVKKSLDTMNSHYDEDNISKRNNWMQAVDSKQERDHQWIESLSEILAQIQATVLSIRIENMRSEIISFASVVIDPEASATRDQFDRIFRLHTDYESILSEAHKTNGETTLAMTIIKEAYEERMRKHSFIEDIRGY